MFLLVLTIVADDCYLINCEVALEVLHLRRSADWLFTAPVPAYAGRKAVLFCSCFYFFFFLNEYAKTAERRLAPYMAGRRTWLGMSYP